MASERMDMRAADEDRERVVAALREQTAQGRLTLEEFDQRMSAAYQAKTWGRLRELLADLPVDLRFGRPPGGAERGPAAAAGPATPQVRRVGPRRAPLLVVPFVVCAIAVASGHFGAIVPLVIFALLVVRRFALGSQGRFPRMSGWTDGR